MRRPQEIDTLDQHRDTSVDEGVVVNLVTSRPSVLPPSPREQRRVVSCVDGPVVSECRTTLRGGYCSLTSKMESTADWKIKEKGVLTMAMQEWFDAMAAKDIDAVMATFHEDLLVVLNEQLLTREEMKEGFQHSMAGEDWIMSDFNIKFEDDHSLSVDFKGSEKRGAASVQNGGRLQRWSYVPTRYIS